MLLLLALLPLASSQIDYSQLFSIGGNHFPLFGPDKQLSPASFYGSQSPVSKPAARGVPINFSSLIHNVKTGATVLPVEILTTPSPTTRTTRHRRQRHWQMGYSYDAYAGGRSPGGYYSEDDGYGEAPYPPPRRPRPRPRRPPPRYKRPEDCCEGYGRSPPGTESSEGTSEGGGGGLFAGDGEGARSDKVKVGADGKGTINSDSGGLLSSLAKNLGGEGTKNGKKDDGEGKRASPAGHGADEGVPLEDVKDSGQTRAPGFETATRKSKPSKKRAKGKVKTHKKKHGGDEDEEEEEEEELGSIEEVDGEVKVPKTVDGETYNSDEENEGRKRKSKKRKRGKKHHDQEDEDEDHEDEDETGETVAEFEDEDDENCEMTTTTTTSPTSECEEEDDSEEKEKARQKKAKTKKKDKKKSKKKTSKSKKKGDKCKPKKKKCPNKQKHLDAKRETTVERHGRSEPELVETATNATETTVTAGSKGQAGVDCASEKDEFPTKCGSWKAAGYCENNQATQYLWCRKTCLCSSKRTKRSSSSWFSGLFL